MSPDSIAVAQPARSIEDVDRHLVVLVLVRGVAPGELLRVLPLELIDHLDRGAHRPEALAIEHVQLAAAARPPRVLLEGRLEEHRPEVDAGQAASVHRLRESLAVDPRRTDQLERTGRAASLRQLRAFEQHRARIDRALSSVGMFGDGMTHGSPVSS